MMLVLDIGNTTLHGGVFRGRDLVAEFRKSTSDRATADEIGLFLLQILRERGCAPEEIRAVGAASVVPSLQRALEDGIATFLRRETFFLQPGARTGLKIKIRNPEEVGADRIANAIAAGAVFPGENAIVVDLGTATTFDVVSAQREFLGGAIAPGLRISMETLHTKTAKLPPVDIMARPEALGKSTVGSIQSGLFYGHLGMMRELLARLRVDAFGEEPVRVIGTGGFAPMFAGEKVFDRLEPHLVLEGVRLATEMNAEFRGRKGK